MEKINPQKFRLKIRYIIALSTIAILMTSGQILIHNSLVKLSSDSRIVNIAGRQRMLSQKLSKIALGIESAIPGSEREELLGDLEQSLSLWQESHFGLQYQGGKLKIPSDNRRKLGYYFL